MIAAIVLFALAGQALLPAPVRPPAPPQQSACTRALTTSADAEVCAGEQAERLAASIPKSSPEYARQLKAAAEHYRKAATLSTNVETTILALKLLAQDSDAQHLNDPKQMEQALRDWIRTKPDDLDPAFKLAKLQEDQGLFDSSEETLLDARRRQPESIEPYRMLTQFYSRRITALQPRAQVQNPLAPGSAPGTRDENGVYRIGGQITPPSRLDQPQYPPEAKAAGIQGVVIAEITIAESGDVADARILRSIPALDDAALKAVRNWHYAPTIVNGQAVPVKMTVTVNFSQSR